MKTKNFYKKCLKGYTFFIDNQKTNEPPSHNFQMLVNKLHQLHEILNIGRNSKSKDIDAHTLMLRKKTTINVVLPYVEKQEFLAFPRFIKPMFLEYHTKNTTFKLMLVNEGSITHNVRVLDNPNPLINHRGTYQNLNDSKYKPYPIDFLIEDSFYMGETCVSEQLWQDIMGNPKDKEYDKKTEGEQIRERHLYELSRKYLNRYRYVGNMDVTNYIQHHEYYDNDFKKVMIQKIKDKNISPNELDEIVEECKSLVDLNPFVGIEFEEKNAFEKKIKQKIPIGCVNFYDAIKFCNKLSKQCGLKEYYTKIELEFYDPVAIVFGRKKEFSKTFNQETTCIPILRFMPNFESNGFRLPFALEWWYAFASGFDAYKNKSLKEIGIVELNTNDEFIPLHFKHLKFQDKEKKLLDPIWYSKSENIHYLKATKPNSLGIYDMFSTQNECLGELLFEASIQTPQSPYFKYMLNEKRKNFWTLSKYIDFVTKDTIKASKNPYDTPNGTKQDTLDSQKIALYLDSFDEDITHSHKFQSFDDVNANKILYRSQVTSGMMLYIHNAKLHHSNSTIDNSIKDTLRIVKNNPIR